MTDAERKSAELMSGARTFLVLHKPFMATLALGLRLVVDPNVKTAETDGKSIWYNPSWFATLRADEATAVTAHEVLHVALAHHLRRDGRSPRRWNVACDYVINLILRKEGFALPAGCLLNKSYEGMSSEQVYDKLPMSEDCLPTDPLGGVRDATDEDGTPLSEAAKRDAEADLVVQVRQARAVEETTGTGTGSVASDRAVEALGRGYDWKRELSDLLVATNEKTDFTWMRPNRRYLSMGFYLPTLHGQTLGDLVVAVDTSGSVNKKTLAEFAGVVEELLEAFPGTTIHVIYCDAKVHGDAEVFTHADVPIVFRKAKGGGGTSFRPVFKWIDKKEELEPCALVYLTDLMGDFPEFPDTKYPTIWVTNSPYSSAPFGRVVRALV